MHSTIDLILLGLLYMHENRATACILEISCKDYTVNC